MMTQPPTPESVPDSSPRSSATTRTTRSLSDDSTLAQRTKRSNTSEAKAVWDMFDVGDRSLLPLAYKWYLGKFSSPSRPRGCFTLSFFIPYLLVAVLSFGSIVVAALLVLDSLTTRTAAVTTPFLYDFNSIWQYTVTLPVLVVCLVNDPAKVQQAIAKLFADNVLVMDDNSTHQLAQFWQARFRRRSAIWQLVGVPVGLAMMWLNFRNVTGLNAGHWTCNTAGDGLNVAGLVWLVCIGLCWWVFAVYSAHAVTIVSLFRVLCFRASDVQVDVHHTDECGGVGPVGGMSLRFQYVLTILGINIVLLLLCVQIGPIGSYTRFLVFVCLVPYVLIGVFLFCGLNLPFRAALLEARRRFAGDIDEEIAEISKRTPLTPKNEEEIVLREKKKARGLKVSKWPFDPSAQRKVVTAYVIPILAFLISPLIARLLSP